MREASPSSGTAPSAVPGALLFVDPLAPDAYDETTSEHHALGGTEQMVARIAAALARGRPVTVQQGARREAERTPAGVLWSPLEMPLTRPRGGPCGPGGASGAASAETVVVIQAWKVLEILRARHPRARLHVWLHRFLGRSARRRIGDALEAADAHALCVSETHRRSVAAALAETHGPAFAAHRCHRIYNAVEDGLQPDDSERDPCLLLSLSSGHKGRGEILDAFSALRRRMPGLRLLVADPGYMPGSDEALPPGVRFLGSLPRPQVIALLRRSLGLFYPQTCFAETFGLVLAEANAVGTPVLAHPLGAAPEVVSDWQLVDGTDPEAIHRRVQSWQRGEIPAVALRPDLRLGAVLEAWEGLLAPPGRAAEEPRVDRGGLRPQDPPAETRVSSRAVTVTGPRSRPPEVRTR